MNTVRAWLGGVLLIACATAHAHTGSSSFLMLHEQAQGVIRAEMDFALRDLSQLMPLDADADGTLTWSEVDRAQSAIESAVLERTRMSAAGKPCAPSPTRPLAIAQHGDGPYARVSFEFHCPSAAAQIVLNHSGWFAFDAAHRALLEYTSREGAMVQAILTDQQPAWHETASRGDRIVEFLIEGGRHLVTGYDHLAFLGVLLLGLVRRREVTQPVRLSTSIKGAFGVITAFTAAHSVTLGLAAMGHLTLPSQPVEIAIAASVICAALLNLRPQTARHGWKLAFGFGLVHGLGFAGALAELAGDRLDWWALAAFNIGIELAQIGVAALALPLVWWSFRNARAERIAVPLITCAVAGVALTWVVARFGTTV